MNQDIFDLRNNLNPKKSLVVYNKIQTTGGQSGSPAFLEIRSNDETQKSQYQVIGVHVGSN